MELRRQAERGGYLMKKRKLNYRFHNPNTVEETANVLYKVFIEVNKEKVEKAVQENLEKSLNNDAYIVKHLA